MVNCWVTWIQSIRKRQSKVLPVDPPKHPNSHRPNWKSHLESRGEWNHFDFHCLISNLNQIFFLSRILNLKRKKRKSFCVRNGRRTILFLSRSFFRWFDGSLGRWCEIMTPIDYRLVWWRMSPILVHIHHGACQAWPRALTPLTPNSAGRKTNHHHWSGEKRSPTVSKKILYNFNNGCF